MSVRRPTCKSIGDRGRECEALQSLAGVQQKVMRWPRIIPEVGRVIEAAGLDDWAGQGVKPIPLLFKYLVNSHCQFDIFMGNSAFIMLVQTDCDNAINIGPFRMMIHRLSN